MAIIDRFWELGINFIPEDLKSKLTIKGIWDTNMFFQPHPRETLFELNFMITQTHHQGCSFYDPTGIDRNKFTDYIGQHFSIAHEACLPIKISVLDSLFAFEKKQLIPTRQLEKFGNPTEKATWRAQTVCEEVQYLLLEKDIVDSSNIILLGYSGLILDGLLSLGFNVIPFDLNPKLIGLEVRPGIKIFDGRSVEKHFVDSDLAVITGMTLATDTLEIILKDCRRSNTKLVVYAQTAPNIAPWYLPYGATSVVCEYIPFYNYEGASTISVFRSEDWKE